MGLPPDLFKRLSQLNRQLARGALGPGDALKPRDPPPPPAALEDVIPGREHAGPGGACYLVRRRAEDFGPVAGLAADGQEADDLLRRYRRVFFGAGRAHDAEALSDHLRPLVLADPESVTYLDIETCGLAGEPVFLVGLMRYGGGALVIEQFLARDYSEEGPVLAAAWEALARSACLVTFNGKTFDLPAVEARSLACGLFARPSAPEHVDLLLEARRRWRGVLPNCRLQTLEQLVCDRRRAGDILGADIPAAYHEFVRAAREADPRRRSRSLRRMQTILHHNALDLLTMADLATRLLAGTA